MLTIPGTAALFTAGVVIWLVTRSNVTEIRIGAGGSRGRANP